MNRKMIGEAIYIRVSNNGTVHVYVVIHFSGSE
jgi:hypothetical protein